MVLTKIFFCVGSRIVRDKIVLYYNDLVNVPSESFLHKDFGQVPFVLAQLYDCDLEYWIAAANLNSDFKEFRGKRVRQFGKSLRFAPDRFDVLKNRRLYRTIDSDEELSHLVIFPFTPVTDLAVARRAKRRRPNLRIMVKLDTNVEFLARIAADWRRFERTPARNLRQSYHYRELLKMADVLLVETNACFEILTNCFLGLDLGNKLVQTFSGLSESWLAASAIERGPRFDRRQSIIVSGRISSHQKYSELIFAAGPPPPGWSIEFIGEVDAAFAERIALARAKDPEFDRYYQFHGAIADKRAYFDLLLQAQVLLMNSRGGEGFPNVFAEAHFCGLTIITSDVSGAAEATGSGRWGLIYRREDVAALRAALLAIPALVAEPARQPAPDTYRHKFIWEHSLEQPAIHRLFAASQYRAEENGRP